MAGKTCFWVVLVVFLTGHAFGADELRLIPSPADFEMGDGFFDMSKAGVVVLADGDDKEDRFAAQQLAREIRADLGLELKIESLDSKLPSGAILLGRLGDDVLVKAGVNAADLGADGYVLRIGVDGICIGGSDAAGVFYGVQTLKQIVRANAVDGKVPCCLIEDKPGLKYRGWQDDISRGPIPTLDQLKREIRTLSEFKMNLFTMYTQTVFKLDGHPDMAPADGITAAEVKELCRYAKKYHVEVIGNFQSFYHAHFLHSPAYHDLAVYINRGVRKGELAGLNPANEKVYDFLRGVYDEIAPAYDSELFMVNCDEVFYLDGSVDVHGNPDKKLDAMIEQMGLGGVYAYHINRLAELLKAHGKRPMIWADSPAVISPQQWGTGQEKTAFGGNTREALAKMSKDVTLVAWEYEAWDDFNEYLNPLIDSGRDVFVAPGISSWGHIFPITPKAVVNISNFVRDGAKAGAQGLLLTTWDDSGESLFGYGWYPLVWGAECSWSPVPVDTELSGDDVRSAKLKRFDRAYPSLFYGSDTIDSRTLQLLDIRENTAHTAGPVYGTALGYFWMDPVLSAEQAREPAAVDTTIAIARGVIRKLTEAKGDTRYHTDNLDYIILAARRCLFAGLAVKAGRAAKDAEANPEEAAKAVMAFEELANAAEGIKAEFKRLWGLENRANALESVLGRYDQLILKLEEHAERLRELQP